MDSSAKKRINKKLAKKPACYVLITCECPSDDGHMQVEMTYEGDATTAAFLLQGAQNFIGFHDEMEHHGSDEKVYPLPAIANH